MIRRRFEDGNNMATPSTIPPKAPPVPPLKEGDRLTRDEFERRYEAMPEVKKAELIEGVVHMPSPVRWPQHSNPHANLIGWLVAYNASTPGVQVGASGSIRLDLQNEPQPDAAMIIEPAYGGQVQLSEDGYVVGAPELVAEVSASTVHIDLNEKHRVYARNGVREYLVWRVEVQAVDWFALKEGKYQRLSLNSAGVYQSEVFPGLRLNQAALIQSDVSAVFQVLQQGVASPEHAAFVGSLRQTAARS
jgi:Uma2 family endonuclease